MATPAIQTLMTDAQQVLNLKSVSEIHATLAAVLANANVGTPLNPNLTTQQLWDEFYEIVRQTPTDIESIIVNQMMKFVFSPPAPGGAGADGQVIFNDGGVLAGDPQFLWNKTTNLLTVTGSATITGDLTVATNKLKVTGGNVGIGTATPTNYANYTTLTINGTNGGEIDLTDGGTLRGQLFSESTGLTLAAVGGFIKFGAGTGGTEKMRLDSTGNVGIGVTPSAWGSTLKTIQCTASSYSSLVGGYIGATLLSIVGHNVRFDGANWIRINADQASFYRQSDGTHRWELGGTGLAGSTFTPTQAMTLDASGNLLVGTTSGTLFRIISSFLSSSGNGGIKLIDSQSNNTAAFANFSNGTGTLGSITNNNNGGVLYNTLSDYRLKEAVQPLVGGLARVNALKPSIYKWKTNGSNGEGFLAHELAEIVPAAVCGEKDAVNEDGSIKSQGVDMSRVVPILVAAIQELAAEVNALKKA